MATIDLRGIFFRPYLPQFDQDTEEYDPAGPGDASRTSGAVDLSCIGFRAWEQNDIVGISTAGGDAETGGIGGSDGSEGSGGSGGEGEGGEGGDDGGTDNTISDTLRSVGSSSTSTITETITEINNNQSSTSTQTVAEIIGYIESVSTSSSSTTTISDSTSEQVRNTAGERSFTAYGSGNYGSGVYGGEGEDNQTISETIT